jgi:hypothetical protein
MTKNKFFAACLVLMAALPLVAKAGPNLNPPDESFFTHLHDQRAMANVTISAVHAGAVEISIQLETVEELPLKAESVSVTLGNPDKGVAPVTTQAQRTADDQCPSRWPPPKPDDGTQPRITRSRQTVNIAAPILIY